MDVTKDSAQSGVSMQNSITGDVCEAIEGPVSEAAMNSVQDVVSNLDPMLTNIQEIIRPIPDTVDEITKNTNNNRTEITTSNDNKEIGLHDLATLPDKNIIENENKSISNDCQEPKINLAENDSNILPKESSNDVKLEMIPSQNLKCNNEIPAKSDANKESENPLPVIDQTSEEGQLKETSNSTKVEGYSPSNVANDSNNEPAIRPSSVNEKSSETEQVFCKEQENVEVKEEEEEEHRSPLLTQEEWERRENELLLKIMDLEKQKDNASVEGIRMQLKVREEENDLLKHKVRSLESELKAVLNNPDSNKNKELVADIKKQHEELIAKARAMIFDKTKMVRNQELQIEALTGQVSSLKEVVGITKDLLGIRNMEVKHLRERLDLTEEKILAERERQKMLTQRVDTGMKKNEELRCEYTQQLSLFKELREKYEARVEDLKNENKKLADQIDLITKKF